ncbi:MAG: hypothetical protein ACLFWB_09810 [Armatimonadota bacterium]
MATARRDNLRRLLILVALFITVVFAFQAVDLWLLGSFPRTDCTAEPVSPVSAGGDTYLPVQEHPSSAESARTSPAAE